MWYERVCSGSLPTDRKRFIDYCQLDSFITPSHRYSNTRQPLFISWTFRSTRVFANLCWLLQNRAGHIADRVTRLIVSRCQLNNYATLIFPRGSMMKVLIAIDGSPLSFEAIRQACLILSPERDEAVLWYSPPAMGATVLALVTVEQGRASLADAIFTEAIDHLPECWKGTVQRIVGSEDPRIGIVNCAEQCGAEIIVVGARGLGAVARVLLGSVSRSVVHTAKMPVLVVRAGHENSNRTGNRVLLACENTDTGRQMGELLSQFSWPRGSSCTVLNVVPSLLGGSIPNWLAAPARSPEVEELIKGWVEEEKSRLANARQEIQTVRMTLPAAFQESSAIVMEGNPASKIVEAAQRAQSNLIVVGSKGATPLGRFFVGSTCESVLNHAPCSVLVVHHA